MTWLSLLHRAVSLNLDVLALQDIHSMGVILQCAPFVGSTHIAKLSDEDDHDRSDALGSNCDAILLEWTPMWSCSASLSLDSMPNLESVS